MRSAQRVPGILTALAVAVAGATASSQNDFQFEAAAVKKNRSLDAESGDFENGRYFIHAAPLRHLVASAYNMRVGLVVGGANWMDTDHFDVDAKAPEATSQDETRLMLRTLLKERFSLSVHFEDRLKPVFLLVVAKGGPKIQPGKGSDSKRPGCIGSGPVQCTDRTMAQVADLLPRISSGVEIPVVDETRLTGRYSFKLNFSPPSAGTNNVTESRFPTIFEALPAQLGLRLKAAKRPIRFLVIDGAHRSPIED